MIDRYEAQKLLIKNGYKVLINSPYRVPVVLESKFEDVKRFLDEQGYTGGFAVIRTKNTIKQ